MQVLKEKLCYLCEWILSLKGSFHLRRDVDTREATARFQKLPFFKMTAKTFDVFIHLNVFHGGTWKITMLLAINYLFRYAWYMFIDIHLVEQHFSLLDWTVDKLVDAAVKTLYLCFCSQGLVKKHPDIRMEQLINLMLCRGDMSRSEARQVIFCTASSSFKHFKADQIMWTVR